MSLYKQFKADNNLEQNGVWIDYGETDDGKPIRFLIARAGGSNQRFNKVIEKKSRPYRRQIQANTIDPKILNKITLETYAEAIVLDWQNVQDESGDFLPFTTENCVKVLSDLPDLYDDIVGHSQRLALFKSEVDKEDSKNS